MPALLILLFVIVPLAELAIVIQIGQVIGVGWTLLLLIADSVLGAVLLRREGRRAWTDFRVALNEARWPGDEVTQGALVIVGGTLLLTPGFLTDILGLLLLLPPTRAFASKLIRTRFTPPPVRVYQGLRDRQASSGGQTAGAERHRDGRRSGQARGPGGEVLDVEVVEIRREGPPNRPTDAGTAGPVDAGGDDPGDGADSPGDTGGRPSGP